MYPTEKIENCLLFLVIYCIWPNAISNLENVLTHLASIASFSTPFLPESKKRRRKNTHRREFNIVPIQFWYAAVVDANQNNEKQFVERSKKKKSKIKFNKNHSKITHRVVFMHSYSVLHWVSSIQYPLFTIHNIKSTFVYFFFFFKCSIRIMKSVMRRPFYLIDSCMTFNKKKRIRIQSTPNQSNEQHTHTQVSGKIDSIKTQWLTNKYQ